MSLLGRKTVQKWRLRAGWRSAPALGSQRSCHWAAAGARHVCFVSLDCLLFSLDTDMDGMLDTLRVFGSRGVSRGVGGASPGRRGRGRLRARSSPGSRLVTKMRTWGAAATRGSATGGFLPLVRPCAGRAVTDPSASQTTFRRHLVPAGRSPVLALGGFRRTSRSRRS